jgi:hypothetical protein
MEHSIAQCSACTGGRFALSAEAACTACAVGRYHEASGQSCKTCEAGQIADRGGHGDAYHRCGVCIAKHELYKSESNINFTDQSYGRRRRRPSVGDSIKASANNQIFPSVFCHCSTFSHCTALASCSDV